MKYTLIKTVAIYLLTALKVLTQRKYLRSQLKKNHVREAYSLPIGYLFPNSPSQMVKLMHHLQYRKAQVSTEVVK